MDDLLDPAELEAVRAAAVWYACHQAAHIGELAGHRAAFALSEVDEYRALIRGLAKLGVRLPLPEGLEHSVAA